MQDAFTVQKGYIKCTVVQNEAHWPPFLVLIFNQAICVDIKNILYKKSLICLITGTNILKKTLTPYRYGHKVIYNSESVSFCKIQ